MNKNKIPPLHPGVVLSEEFMKPLKLSQNQIARELCKGVAINRLNH